MSDNSITETRTVVISIPALIENFYFALQIEDYQKCSILKQDFYDKYKNFSPSLKRNFKKYLLEYFEEIELDRDKDLNGFFDEVFLENKN